MSVLRLGAVVRLALFLALAGFLGCSHPAAADWAARNAAIPTVPLAALPAEAKQTLLLIQKGGPFPYPYKDGSIFGNFERHLPEKKRGYYREYTVPTPGRSDRGPRRIIAGEGIAGSVAASGEYYYTGDHYRSFLRIRQE